MATIKFKNKRTRNVCEIHYSYFFDLIKKKAKNVVDLQVKFPLKTNSGEFHNSAEIFDFLEKFRFRQIKVVDHKHQSYEGVIHNTIIATDKESNILPYIYNETQGDKVLMMDDAYFNIVANEIIDYLRLKDFNDHLQSWLQFFEEFDSGDIIYIYVESYLFYVGKEDIKVSKLLENPDFFKNLKVRFMESKDESIGDLFECLQEEYFDEISDNLTQDEEDAIAEEKMVKISDDKLEKYYFENNYNVITVLNNIK